MQPTLSPTDLNGSSLVGLLAQWSLVDGPAAKPSFVEGLSQWLGWTHAIDLSAALNAAAPGAVPALSARPGAAAEFNRVRAALVRAIEDDGSAPRGGGQPRTRAGPAVAAPVATEDLGTDFSAHRQRCIRLQQSMESAIAPLRAKVRASVAALSPQLSQLAALDAVMADVLGEREQALLGTLPSVLQKHFDRLQRAAPSEPGTPATAGSAPPAWLPRFRQDMQRLLLAELDLRLQPVLGLLEAGAAHPSTKVS
jgi:hypothetical protein